MAKKSRTPAPPVRVQAPKRREHPRAQGAGGRFPDVNGTRALGIGAAVVVVAGIIVGVVLATGGSSNGANQKEALAKVTSIAEAAGCTMRTVPASTSGNHVSSLDAKITWNSYPPTSGKHYNQQTRLGNYSTIAEPRQAVHNLEHGAVVIWYQGISTDQRQQLSAFYDEDPNGLMVTPIDARTTGITYPKSSPSMAGKIALTAWDSDLGKGLIMTCSGVEQKPFAAFRDAFRYHGPERFAPSAMLPGGG